MDAFIQFTYVLVYNYYGVSNQTISFIKCARVYANVLLKREDEPEISIFCSILLSILKP